MWVVPVSNLAGVARHVIDVARVGLPGYRLVVAAPEGALLDALRTLGCAVAPLAMDGGVLQSVKSLRTVIRRERPAVVHSHLAKADFLAALSATGLPVILISTEHGIPEDPRVYQGTAAKAAIWRAAHHGRIRRFAALIAVSESTKRVMERWWKPRAPIHVVLNGADRLPQTTKAPGLRILSLTRLAPEKNLAMTLRVFARVARDHPDARLTIAGDGPDREPLEALAIDLGIKETVDFPGFVEPVAFMAKHDVLLQPSKADNLSYTLIDAINTGMGVVASRVGGNPELLPEHCLADVNDEEAMAAGVIEQGMVPGRRPSLPQAVPSVAGMADQFVAIYQGLNQ